MSFSGSLLAVCLGLLFFILAYTFWLLRSDRLTSSLAVKWIFLEILAAITIVVWGRLPFIRFTSSLSDRQMLLILACILFVFFSLLILECMVQTSKHTNQTRQLTQELALLKLQVEEDRKDDNV